MEPVLNNNLEDGKMENTEEFLVRYNKLLSFIESKAIISSIEEAYKLIYSVGFKSMSLARINNVLIRLFDGDIENLNTFNMYMQNLKFNYANKATLSNQINAKLKKLRDVYFELTMYYSAMISEPFNLGGASASIQHNSPNINVIVDRNDGRDFALTLNFNSLITLVNQLNDILNKKIVEGNNQIDIQLINNYIELSLKFQHSIDNFKKTKIV